MGKKSKIPKWFHAAYERHKIKNDGMGSFCTDCGAGTRKLAACCPCGGHIVGGVRSAHDAYKYGKCKWIDGEIDEIIER